eukprot:UN00511
MENFEYYRSNVLRGGYMMNKTATYNDYPFWMKPVNDYTNEVVYIYYDEFYGYWQIGKYLGGAIIVCHNANTPYPEKCEKWYDLYSHSLAHILNIRVEGCSSKDILKKSNKQNNVGMIAAVVIVIIVVVFLCGLGAYFFYDKQLKNKSYESFDGHRGGGDTEMM